MKYCPLCGLWNVKDDHVANAHFQVTGDNTNKVLEKTEYRFRTSSMVDCVQVFRDHLITMEK